MLILQLLQINIFDVVREYRRASVCWCCLHFVYVLAEQAVEFWGAVFVIIFLSGMSGIPVFFATKHVQMTRIWLRYFGKILVGVCSVAQLHLKLVGIEITALYVTGWDVLVPSKIAVDGQLRRFCHEDTAAVLRCWLRLAVIGFVNRDEAHLPRQLLLRARLSLDLTLELHFLAFGVGGHLLNVQRFELLRFLFVGS